MMAPFSEIEITGGTSNGAGWGTADTGVESILTLKYVEFEMPVDNLEDNF